MISYKLIISILLISILGHAQKDTSQYDPIRAVVFLDSFVVTASRDGFNVDDFIKLVKEDESFYRAFRNARFTDINFSNDIELFNKKGKGIAHYNSNAIQQSDGRCRTMREQNVEIKGNYFKKKNKHRYYTAQLYHRLFFTEGKICENPEKVGWDEGKKGTAKHISELKKLIFSPGRPADVPIIGNKTAIFEEKMIPYYDYRITSKPHDSGVDCYVFEVKVKSIYQEKKAGKTVIKFLETYFAKETLQVVGRKYQLASSTTLFDFDVKMNIQLQLKENKYIPKLIEYDGNWDIPFRKPEIAKFQLLIQ